MRGHIRSVLVAATVALVAAEACAVRHIGFEADAFNRVYPTTYRNTFVFSPVSFELDCVQIAESLDIIPKANVASMMGVVIDFPSAYCPILDALETRTNGFSFVSARGFCVPDVRKANVILRSKIQREYRTEVMRVLPKEGAEAWFRASMDGEMENFELPATAVRPDRCSLIDLVSFSVAWRDPFPAANTRMMPFMIDEASNTVDIAFMSDVRIADTWENKEYTLLMLPLKGDASFFALLPKDGYSVSDARTDMTSIEIDSLISLAKPGTLPNAVHGPCSISMPRLSISSRSSFAGALRYFRVPTTGLSGITGDVTVPGGAFEQFTKFSLAECGRDEKPLQQKNPEDVVPVTAETKRLVFDRPFLFFVYHSGTATILAAGQFSGADSDEEF